MIAICCLPVQMLCCELPFLASQENKTNTNKENVFPECLDALAKRTTNDDEQTTTATKWNFGQNIITVIFMSFDDVSRYSHNNSS